MPITPRNIVRHELCGLKVLVKSPTKAYKQFSGRVVDETYNTLKIETRNGEKVVIKNNCIFVFTLPNRTKVQVDGKLLIGRPEDRIKKHFKAVK